MLYCLNHYNDLSNAKYTLLDTSNNLKRIIAGGGIIEDSSLNKLEYGVYRFNKLTQNNSPSGLDNDGVLLVLPIIYSSKFCLQIFWGYTSDQVHLRICWYEEYRNWIKLG